MKCVPLEIVKTFKKLRNKCDEVVNKLFRKWKISRNCIHNFLICQSIVKKSCINCEGCFGWRSCEEIVQTFEMKLYKNCEEIMKKLNLSLEVVKTLKKLRNKCDEVVNRLFVKM